MTARKKAARRPAKKAARRPSKTMAQAAENAIKKAPRSSNDFHMEGEERKPGLLFMPNLVTTSFVTQEKHEHEVALARASGIEDGRKWERESEAVRRAHTLGIEDKGNGCCGVSHAEMTRRVFDEPIRGSGFRAATSDEPSDGMLAIAIKDVNGAMTKALTIHALVEKIADEHLGTRPESGDASAKTATPSGRVFELHRALTELHGQLDELHAEVRRLVAL